MSEITVLTGSIIKALLTNDILVSVLNNALVYRGTASSLSKDLESGFYQVIPDTEDRPEEAYSYGGALMVRAGSFFLQLYFPHQAYGSLKGGIWKRIYFKDTWKPWEYYAPTPLT